jgi:hypothetical protein
MAVYGSFWPESEAMAAAVAAGYWGAPVAVRGAAEPSMAATPRLRRLSEQVLPRRLQELVALDDPDRSPRHSALMLAA